MTSFLSSRPSVPTNLRVNDTFDPIGTSGQPYFGWHLVHSESNEIQTQYRVLVASSEKNLDAERGDVWDSGAVAGRTQNHVAYAGTPLSSNTKYFWKVRFWDRHGNVSPFSDTAAFVTGLLKNEDWAGSKWIRRDPVRDRVRVRERMDADDYTYYRKVSARFGKRIERATVFITAVHKYELYVNGALVGKGPSYHYPQYQYYNAYDVTANLFAGTDNVFAVFTHWFGGGQGRPASERGLLMKAVIGFADGTSECIGTDGSWKQTRAESWVPGQPQRNAEGVGYVERIDARKLILNWYALDFDDAEWDAAVEIGAQPASVWTARLNEDLTRIREETVYPVSISKKGQGTYVVDLGAVYAGRPRIEFEGGEAGQIVTIRGGYALGGDGRIDSQRNQATDMSYYAMASGSAFTFLPCEYLGMRHVQIENAPMAVTAENFSFVERHAELEERASGFTSSHPTLNAVWDLCKRSLYCGAQEQFIDTPTREKGGFLVDSMNESLAAMMAFGERVLTRKALHEFLQSMEQYWSSEQDRGRMNAVYPNSDGARDIPDFTQAYLVWVWEYYVQTGDVTFLREHNAKLKSIADYAEQYRDARTGLIHRLRGGDGAYLFGIVDWTPSMRYGYEMAAEARTVINCYAYANAEIVARIADVLDKPGEVQAYLARAQALKDAINTRLLEDVYVDGLMPDGRPCAHKSQQANTFPLALGIVPPEKQADVLEHVKKLKMRSGMVTVYWLMRALGEMEQGEHLLELYTNVEWDGWAKNLAQGATCTWESWDAQLGGNLSQSHPWGSVGLVGIQQYVLGVRPLAPQYERVQIKPLWFGDALCFAQGRVPTERGEIFVRWENKRQRFEMTVELPVNVEAKVCLPRGAASDARVMVDGVSVEAGMEGNFVVVDGVGSGRHGLLFQMPTTLLDELECHVRTLNPGESPHPPHQHRAEEMIILKEETLES